MNITLEVLLEIVIPLGGLIAWMWSRLDKRFDVVLSEIKELRHDMNAMQVQLGKLETRVEERTLKVVHVEKTGTQGGIVDGITR